VNVRPARKFWSVGPRAGGQAGRSIADIRRQSKALEATWLLPTAWLRQLRSTQRARAQARYALQWRPIFLATVALSRSVILGARAAKVSPQTVMAHRKADPDFDAQVALSAKSAKSGARDRILAWGFRRVGFSQ
jgi:hypothetical protein